MRVTPLRLSAIASASVIAAVVACTRDDACDSGVPRCDQGDLVICVDGREERSACGDGAYCNFGACVETSIRIPEDLGPHEYRTEWWYYTGHLESDAGRYGFEVTIFQFLLGPMETYMCHVAVIDGDAGAHYHVDETDFAPGTWTSDPVELEVHDCRFQLGADGVDRIWGAIPEGAEADGHPGAWELELVTSPTKPMARHGGDGVIAMGDAGGESWYYSRTRLVAEGTLTTPEHGEQAIAGQAWTDHQWGDFDVNQFQGWDWWSLQLEDGYEVMLFQFRNWESVLVSQAGTIVDPDGNLTELERFDDFGVTSLRTWESPHTDGTYPLDWDITISPMSWTLRARTAIDDQEMHNPLQNYWEGAVSITGSRGDRAVNGVGFVELTGYATDPFDP